MPVISKNKFPPQRENKHKYHICGICGMYVKGSYVQTHMNKYHKNFPRFFTIGENECSLWKIVTGEDYVAVYHYHAAASSLTTSFREWGPAYALDLPDEH